MSKHNLLGERYRVLGVLGEGRTSVVLLATDLRLDRKVAIKVLRTTLSANRTAVTRFRREADNACALDHPGIVGVYDTGVNGARSNAQVQDAQARDTWVKDAQIKDASVNDAQANDAQANDAQANDAQANDGAGGRDDMPPVPYIVVEYVDGDTLHALLARDGRLPASRALAITAAILEALEFAHRHGVVHRALSAATVMLNSDGVAKVMDFGVGVAVPPQIGALQCASPEQLVGAPVDARSDVYSCGCLLWQMLSGRPLFDADSPMTLARQHLWSSAAKSSARPEVPADLVEIVGKATQTAPLDRYQTATEMRTAVRAVMSRQLLPASGGPAATGHGIGSIDVQERPSFRTSRLLPAGTAPAPPLPQPPLLQPPDLAAAVAGSSGSLSAGRDIDRDDLAGDDLAGDDSARDDGDRGHRSRWGCYLLAAVCAVLLSGAALATGVVLTAAPPPTLVAVPDLSGRSLEQAAEILRGRGLVLGTVGRVESSDSTLGKVVDQRPSRLTQVDRSTVVSVEIGRGVTVVAVPNLAGSTATQARARLAAVMLVYAQKLKASSDADRGKVIAQDASAQSQVRPGSTVTVTVGTGLDLVAVPDGLVGTDVDAARTALRAAGLSLVMQQGDGAEPVNQVIAVDQPAGRRVPLGTPVTVTVSNNTLMVMPGLTGRPQDAVRSLQNLGWAGDLGALAVSGQPTPNPAAVGTIVAQDPAPGSVVRKIGTPVRIQIGVRQLTMPSLVGRTQQQAIRTLTRAGATNVAVVDAGSAPRGRTGRVATQSIPPGTPVAADTPLVLGVFTR